MVQGKQKPFPNKGHDYNTHIIYIKLTNLVKSHTRKIFDLASRSCKA